MNAKTVATGYWLSNEYILSFLKLLNQGISAFQIVLHRTILWSEHTAFHLRISPWAICNQQLSLLGFLFVSIPRFKVGTFVNALSHDRGCISLRSHLHAKVFCYSDRVRHSHRGLLVAFLPSCSKGLSSSLWELPFCFCPPLFIKGSSMSSSLRNPSPYTALSRDQ